MEYDRLKKSTIVLTNENNKQIWKRIMSVYFVNLEWELSCELLSYTVCIALFFLLIMVFEWELSKIYSNAITVQRVLEVKINSIELIIGTEMHFKYIFLGWLKLLEFSRTFPFEYFLPSACQQNLVLKSMGVLKSPWSSLTHSIVYF